MFKTGIDFNYRIQVHKSLKRLLREVTNMKDKNMQLKNIGKVYQWYFRKLESIGLLSNQEKDEEEMLLNPSKIDEIQRRREEQVQEKKRQLMEPKNILKREQKFFEE